MRPEEQTLTCRAMDMAPQHEEGGARGGARPQNQPPQAAADLRGASEAGQAVVAQVQRGQLAAGAQVGEHADVVAREVQVLRARAGPQAAAVSSLHPGPGTLRKAQHTCEGADLYTLTRLHQACMPSRAVQDEGASGCPPGLCIMHSLLTGRVLSPTTRSLGQATIGLPPPPEKCHTSSAGSSASEPSMAAKQFRVHASLARRGHAAAPDAVPLGSSPLLLGPPPPLLVRLRAPVHQGADAAGNTQPWHKAPACCHADLPQPPEVPCGCPLD